MSIEKIEQTCTNNSQQIEEELNLNVSSSDQGDGSFLILSKYFLIATDFLIRISGAKPKKPIQNP